MRCSNDPRFNDCDDFDGCGRSSCPGCPECMDMAEELPADLAVIAVGPQAGDFVISHEDMECPDIFAALERATARAAAVAS
ncbi:MAG: hypothetical protein EKK55_07000 [Rhodocyclaceae bacterium]|nr:MAG: hypothetical protein EKK55_07000 [Rhodocyclaceae bacterium]